MNSKLVKHELETALGRIPPVADHEQSIANWETKSA